MTDVQLVICWSCEMAQPEAWDESLHLEECLEHDEETCLACVELEREENVDD